MPLEPVKSVLKGLRTHADPKAPAAGDSKAAEELERSRHVTWENTGQGIDDRVPKPKPRDDTNPRPSSVLVVQTYDTGATNPNAGAHRELARTPRGNVTPAHVRAAASMVKQRQRRAREANEANGTGGGEDGGKATAGGTADGDRAAPRGSKPYLKRRREPRLFSHKAAVDNPGPQPFSTQMPHTTTYGADTAPVSARSAGDEAPKPRTPSRSGGGAHTARGPRAKRSASAMARRHSFGGRRAPRHNYGMESYPNAPTGPTPIPSGTAPLVRGTGDYTGPRPSTTPRRSNSATGMRHARGPGGGGPSRSQTLDDRVHTNHHTFGDASRFPPRQARVSVRHLDPLAAGGDRGVVGGAGVTTYVPAGPPPSQFAPRPSQFASGYDMPLRASRPTMAHAASGSLAASVPVYRSDVGPRYVPPPDRGVPVREFEARRFSSTGGAGWGKGDGQVRGGSYAYSSGADFAPRPASRPGGFRSTTGMVNLSRGSLHDGAHLPHLQHAPVMHMGPGEAARSMLEMSL